MAENATVFRSVQIGPEGTPGTAVPATKRLIVMSLQPQAQQPGTPFRPMGQLFASTVLIRKKRVAGPITGPWSYNDLTYLANGILHATTPTTPAGATTAREWNFSPNNFTPNNLKTFTIEVAGPESAERATYAIFNTATLRATEEDTSVQGEIIAKSFQPGITLTPGATTIPEAVINPISLAGYIGTSFANKVQSISLGGATGGDFKIVVQHPHRVGVQTTVVIPYNAAPAVVQTALENLECFDVGDVTVGGAAGAYTVTTLGTLNGIDVPTFTLDTASLTGGTPTVTVTTPGGLTKLLRFHEFEWGLTGRVTVQDTLDPTEEAWTYAVERPPDVASRMVIQHDAVSQGFLAAMQNSESRYLQLQSYGTQIEASYKHFMRLRLPIKFTGIEVADRNDVQAATYPLTVVFDAAQNFAVQLMLRNAIAAL